MKIRALLFSLLAVTFVLGCTRNEPVEEPIPPAPDFEAPSYDDDMNQDMDMDMDTEDELDETDTDQEI